MVGSTVIPSPYFGCYSMVAVPIGGFIFGIGAVLTNGCVTSTLVKVGDGRIIGILSLIVFATTEYFTNKWIFKPFTQKVMGLQEVYDIDLFDMPFSPIIIFAPVAVLLYILMFHHYRVHRPKYKLPQSSHRDAPRLLRKDLESRGNCHTNRRADGCCILLQQPHRQKWRYLNFRPGVIVVQHDNRHSLRTYRMSCL